jgi:hypothetical protein
VFDHVERRRLLVEPSGKDALELALRIAHVDLDEGTGQLLYLPGGGGLAGAQADDHVAGAHRLARSKREVARNAVPLVEEPDHGDPLRHRRRSRSDGSHRLGHVDRLRLGLRLLPLGLGLRRVPPAAAKSKHGSDGHEERQC